MTKSLNVCTTLCLLTVSVSALAGSLEMTAPPTSTSNMPKTGFFLGLGASASSVNVEQDLSATGVSNVYLNNILVASGEAGGPAAPFNDSQSALAPEVQAGYFQNFDNSDWLWGVKFLYSYLGTTSTNNSIDDPQYGAFTSTTEDTFTGNVIVGSSQTSVNHEFALMPFIGHSFKNSFVYLGVGPALFGTESNIYNATGYADINGQHVDITGDSTNFSETNWTWGGAAELGMTYYFDPSWFLDINYTYAMTGWSDNNYSAPFASETDGYVDTGTLYANTSDRLTVQAFSVSINKVF